MTGRVSARCIVPLLEALGDYQLSFSCPMDLVGNARITGEVEESGAFGEHAGHLNLELGVRLFYVMLAANNRNNTPDQIVAWEDPPHEQKDPISDLTYPISGGTGNL